MTMRANLFVPAQAILIETGVGRRATQSPKIKFGEFVKPSNREINKPLLKLSRIKFFPDWSIAKACNKSRAAALLFFSTSYNMFSGAVLSCFIDLIRSDGTLLQILNSIIHHDPRNSAGKFFGYLKTFSKDNGYILSKLNPENLEEKFTLGDIEKLANSLMSHCYRNDYAIFFKAHGFDISDSDQKKAVFSLAMMHSFFEEIVCRMIVQDLILKRFVKKIIQRILPQHASKIDSKIYALCRILMSSYVFVNVRAKSKPEFFSTLGVEIDMRACFIMGIFLGFLKETGGIAASFGANAIQKAALMMPLEIWERCQASK